MKIRIHSGGAQGADATFGNIGRQMGFDVLHHTFVGHSVYGHGEKNYLTEQQLAQADTDLQVAAQRLGRYYPPKSAYVQKLLQRNFYQVKDVQNVIAVAKLEGNMRNVMGGTGWAVAMAIDKGHSVYVFDDGQSDSWFKYSYDKECFTSCMMPVMHDDFAGIGTRELTLAGKEAISSLLSQNNKLKTDLHVWTAQYRYSGTDRFDVTVKGAHNLAFAPSWEMVNAYKTGTLSIKDYREKYRQRMNRSFAENRQAWRELLLRMEVTLVCFCPADEYCHRLDLARMLASLGATYKGERSSM